MQHPALEQLETWGLSRCPLHALPRLEPMAEQLSKSFTDVRPEHFKKYLDDADRLTAYALFFAPQTYTRTYEALSGILTRLPTFPKRPIRILDLGCGLGSAALAANDFFHSQGNNEVETTCVDWSATALQALPEFLPNVITQQQDLRSFRPKGSYDLILISFALNEIFSHPKDALPLLHILRDNLATDAPAFILILEPVVHGVTPRLLALRSMLQQVPIYAPCPHLYACPMLPGKDGICHDVRRFKPSRATTLLNRKLNRSISDVKYALLAFGRPGGPQAQGFEDPEFLRMISTFSKENGRLSCRACMGDGQLRHLQLPIAALTTERRHFLMRRQRGDCAWLAGSPEARKQLEQGRIQRAQDIHFTDEPPPAIDQDIEGFTFSM